MYNFSGTTVEHSTKRFIQMMVFSTVLEIEGRPTLYSVYKNRSLAFLNPPGANAPILFATYENSNWQIKGTNDASIKEQVLSEIDFAD